MSIFHKLENVVARFNELTEKINDPALYQNQKEYQEVTREHAHLKELVETYHQYKEVKKNWEEAKKMIAHEKDEEMRQMAKEELVENEAQIPLLEERLKRLLLPQDPLDDKNVIMEIRAGAGGGEASIFVSDIFRMYQNYCRDSALKTEIISLSESDEGIKEAIFSVSGDKVYSKLKYESGVHRVQRVPKTESQGRVHTSTITVAVLPEASEVDFQLNMNELRIDVYRSSGAGGQSVNTTDSAVRVTHLPTQIVVACQDERSQLKNKEKALCILRARIYDQMVQEQQAKEAAERRGLVGRGDRSERIRTYNYPQGRVSDHRIGLTLYSLDSILEGDLNELIDALVAYNQAELLKGQES